MTMKRQLFSFLIFPLIFCACKKQGEQFTVEGHITEAKDTMLYLEHLTLGDGIKQLDSIKLDEKGDFSLHGPRPTNPEFYRLRIGRQVVNLSIDSTETVSIEARLPQMALGYKVEGSGNCDTIRILAMKLDALKHQLQSVADDRTLMISEREERIQQLVKEYKTDLKLNYIQNRYGRASSYYAMFQTIGDQMVFNPVDDQSDVMWFSALANSWDELYPTSQRTENLHNIAMQGLGNTRRRVVQLDIDNEKIKESGIIDMGFPDRTGRERRLSSLVGQVVILDFTAYAMQGSQERTLALRTLYDRYHNRGLEIYQVSLDADEHYWKTVSETLPWVCVWNSEGLDNDIVSIYNLQALPTWFLIDRGSNLVGRMEMMGNLEDEILKLL